LLHSAACLELCAHVGGMIACLPVGISGEMLTCDR